jgi:hypothetical protein
VPRCVGSGGGRGGHSGRPVPRPRQQLVVGEHRNERSERAAEGGNDERLRESGGELMAARSKAASCMSSGGRTLRLDGVCELL